MFLDIKIMYSRDNSKINLLIVIYLEKLYSYVCNQ